jgi:hypothetical protein
LTNSLHINHTQHSHNCEKVHKSLRFSKTNSYIHCFKCSKSDAMRSNQFIYFGSGLAAFGGLYFLSGLSFANILMGILTLIGAVMAALSGYKYQRCMQSIEEENEEDSVLLLSSLKELIDKNAQLSHELAQYKEPHNYTASHTVVIPVIYPNGSLGFKALKQGEGSIDDLTIEIIDLEKLIISEAPGGSTIEDFRFASNFFHIGSIPAQEVILPATEISLYGEQRSFDITIDTQQGRIIEYLRMYRIDRDWKAAIRIKSESSGHIIYEKIPAEINSQILQW